MISVLFIYFFPLPLPKNNCPLIYSMRRAAIAASKPRGFGLAAAVLVSNDFSIATFFFAITCFALVDGKMIGTDNVGVCCGSMVLVKVDLRRN